MTPKTIGIVGMGLLGRGIAACFVSKGFRVVAHSLGDRWKEESRIAIAQAIDDLVHHGCTDGHAAANWTESYAESDSIADIGDCEFVIESVAEDVMTKRAVLDEIETAVSATVPIATNTSSIPITMLQDGLRHPGRIIGMHWAAPCYATKFLEVIRGEQTDHATVEMTLALAIAVGKDPSLVKKDVAGFIVNRLGYAMFREAFALLESGVADAETIDRSFRHAVGLWASIAGPFRWIDLTGFAPYADAMGRLFPQLSNATAIPTTMQALVACGAKGIANGFGFYRYTPEQAKEWEQRLRKNVWRINSMGPLGDSSCD